MGTFAKTSIVDYHLSFADQGKQTSVFYFHSQKTNGVCRFWFSFSENKQKLPFSLICFPLAEVPKHGVIDMKMPWKLNPFTVCSSWKRQVSVCKWTRRINRLAHLRRNDGIKVRVRKRDNCDYRISEHASGWPPSWERVQRPLRLWRGWRLEWSPAGCSS